MDDNVFAHWLALREPADAAARSEALTRKVAGVVSVHNTVRAVDLATGTGSNIRYLIPHLGPRQEWLAIDRSPALLERLAMRMSERGVPPTCHVETRVRDLGTLDGADVFADRHLVTASALLDLVSEAWLRSLAQHCRAAGAAALFTLTYNGRISCSPADPEDDLVFDLFNRHQRAAKGLGGPAAGPDAAAIVVRCFADAGYHVERVPSDWDLGPGESELQRQLIGEWAEPAVEIAPDAASVIASWRGRRLAHVDAGRSRLIVGHDDIAAWL
ncbi:MAG: class I SAM-dependent methyltransferase [Acidobacteria bacterium]|nr:class I SAM-dependent methyltransferase [Acidobacteriota bacterium]